MRFRIALLSASPFQRTFPLKRAAILALCGFAFLSMPQLLGETSTVPARVGAFGSGRLLDFEGNQTFTADQLRHGLRANPGWMDAAHPAAPLDKFLEASREALQRGYQALGFPAVNVAMPRVEGTPPHVIFSITEGPRYLAGPVRVSGAKSVTAEDIIRHLTTRDKDPLEAETVKKTLAEANIHLGHPSPPKPKSSSDAWMQESKANMARTVDPIPWEVNEPAALNESKPEFLEADLKQFLGTRGYMAARVKVSVEKDDAAHRAALVVTILDEGPHAVLGEVNVTGAVRDSKADIMRYLGLEEGQPMTSKRAGELDVLLERSGRYVSHKVALNPTPDARKELGLQIDLVELPEAPRLSEPLSPVQQTLVKLGAWLEEIKRTGREDIIIDVVEKQKGESHHVAAISSRQKGWLFSFESLPEPGHAAQPARALLRYSNDDLAVLWLGAKGGVQSWRGPRIALPLQSINIRVNPELDEKGTSSKTFFFGASWNPNADGKPMTFELHVPAALFVLWGKDMAPAWQVKDGVAGVTQFADTALLTTLLVEEATGRLKACQFLTPEHKDGSSTRITISTRAGAWEEASKELDEKSAGVPNAYDARDGWPSWAAFVATAFFREGIGLGEHPSPGEVARMSEAVRRSVRDFLQAPLDAFTEALIPGDNPFYIPFSQADLSQIMNPNTALSAVALHFVDKMVDENTWPWLLTREMYYLKNGRTEYLEEMLRQIREDPHLGPVGCYFAGKILAPMNQQAAAQFYKLGLQRLSAADFRRDWQLITDSPVGQRSAVNAVLQRLQKGQQEELVLLKSVLDLFSKKALAMDVGQFADTLRSKGADPLALALAATMDKLWNESLSVQVKGALDEQLAASDPPAPSVNKATVAALVNGVPISRADVAEIAAMQRNALSQVASPNEQQRQMLAHLEEFALNSLIERELVLQEFHLLGGKIDGKVIDAMIQQTVSENFGGKMDAFVAQLATAHMTLQRFRELQEMALIVQGMRQKFVENVPPPTEAEIAAAGVGNPSAAPVHSVKISTITLNKEKGGADQMKLARDLFDQIKKGDAFTQLAKTYSQDARAKGGGGSDWIEEGSLSPTLAQAIAKLKPGQTCEVLDLGTVFMLVRLDDEKTAAPESMSRSQKVEAAKAKKAQDALNSKLQELRSKAKVQIISP